MSWLSKKWRKAKRWVKRNQRLNRALRTLRDIIQEDAIDEFYEDVELHLITDVIRKLLNMRKLF